MRALSQDLRERIFSAYEAGEGSYAVLSVRFAVGPTVVGKLVRQQRKLGTLAAQVHRRGRKPAVAGQQVAELREHLQKYPDATVLERRDALGLTPRRHTRDLIDQPLTIGENKYPREIRQCYRLQRVLNRCRGGCSVLASWRQGL